ncbi:MAG: small multi-drug export protein [Candidatus Abyssubacteria bacterium]
MREALAEFLSSFLSAEGVTFVLAMLPISELRGAMIFAASPLGNLPLSEALPLSLIGNLLPVLPILLLLEPVSKLGSRFSLGERFFAWVFERARSKSEKVKRYEALGLIMFVAIPLPVTGAWTGAAVAFVLGIKTRDAFLAIAAGVMIAGAIMSVAAYGTAALFRLFF